MTVAAVLFDGSLESIGRAIELSGGFANLAPSRKVLIKPNINFSGWMAIPPYGMVTTSTMVQGILQHLAEHGCRDIAIGEGTVAGVLGSNTRRGYKYTGIDRVARRYGAKLIDFNDGPFESADLDGVKVGISKHALEAEFFINVPVLKTHPAVKVSLGMKNLKGCLDFPSRRAFHHRDLDHMIFLLNQIVKCDLTVIDGIYMLEKGTDTLMGHSHRKNLILASRDIYACDCVGSAVLGIEPSEVGYLNEYGKAHNRSIDIGAMPTAGEDMEALRENLEWDVVVAKDLLAPEGITGLSVPSPGGSLCSGCYTNLAGALGLFSKANRNLSLPATEICCGRNRPTAAAGARVILFGNCAIATNRNEDEAETIRGCPPPMLDTLLFLLRRLLSRPRFVRTILIGGTQLLALRAGLYPVNLARWKRYQAPEFDRRHFRWSLRQAASDTIRRRQRRRDSITA